MTSRHWEIIHLALSGVWIAVGGAALAFGWWESVPFVSFMSLYAILVGHWGAYQAARADKD